MQNILPRYLRYATLLGLLVAMAVPAAAASWWNSQWTERARITVDAAASGINAGSQIVAADGSIPVLVRLHSGNFKFDKAKPDGSDIRFVLSDGSPLKFHIEKYDSLLGEAFAWVAVPNIKPSSETELYVYYGNATATAAFDGKGTYDSNTVLVYHFSEHGTAARDVTQWSNVAQNAGAAADGSLIGSGLRLDGHTPLRLPASQSLSWRAGQPVTWSLWVKQTQPAANVVLFSRKENGGGLVIGVDNSVPYVELINAGVPQRAAASANIATGWHHLAVVATGTAITLFVDGEARASLAGAIPALTGPGVLGVDADAQATGFTGEIDELEISNVARSASFVKLLAIGQGPDNGKLMHFGGTEEDAGWSSGYFAVILKSVTIDGWVVIGILMIMAAISWIVMVEKGTYIGKVDKANRHFTKAFGEVASDLTIMDTEGEEAVTGLSGKVTAADRFMQKNSSLYRVYHIGVQELRHRFTGDKVRILSAQSIAAIRAALDGGLAREAQRLNRQMVLLTIAIAGGPFLGLLGTVIGVMVTFASIAASGEVNVNAIAPGIAAALAATVAGLFVAIPALFAYNYLLSRIRNITTDMQVFVDEFTTKMAEFYSESAEV
ncbi:biopolymer transport protein ExbB [Rhizomicrobium palustre]|uniref:Biopolymer transport protein ExbB n=1 Tax=Rhizomicrobium palustre TaxID=189966 RepID=A0A846MZV0_9PROT|nr:MotA/TolQ/ExbB proton channel family protein [Rhizomicrobium palustre]NIK88956.1 biopolymer transport protein ExbB [Rhizomicrobium palustre]